MNTAWRRCLVVAAIASFALTGCNDDPPGLVIVAPADGVTLTEADDEDLELDGIQFTVQVATDNVPDGETLSLFYNGETEGTADDTTIVTDGIADFLVTAVGSQSYELVVCTDNCDDVSNRVTLDAIEGCGARVDFVRPAATGGMVVVGPTSDTTGGSCDGEFTVDVEVSTDAGEGATGELFVNGAPVAMATVVGTLLRFEDVALGRRIGDGPNDLRVEVTNDLGTCDSPDLATQVTVDCEGPSCEFVSPGRGRAFLNTDDDASAEDGFQGDFVVRTSLEAAGQEVELLVDGTPRATTAVAEGDAAEAVFAGVGLSEGLHRFRAICRDGNGNTTDATAEWTVDVTPCEVSYESPEPGASFIDSDDEDPARDGIQVSVSGTVSGEACESVVVGICGSALAPGSIDGGAFTGTVTLSTAESMQELCAEVLDEAENTGESTPVSVSVQSEAPRLRIDTPTPTQAFNIDGTGGANADLEPATPACEATVSILCDEPGATVVLERQDTGGEIATGTCETEAGLPDDFTGLVEFPMAPLPTVNSGDGYNLIARTTVGRLTGTSAPIEVFSDCDAPEFTVIAPTCGSILRPVADDSNGDLSDGFQQTVRVTSAPSNFVDALQLDVETAGGAPISTATRPADTAVVNFTDADFGGGGDVVFRACGTDSSGNQGCTIDCDLRIVDLPSISIESPSSGAIISSPGTCAAGEVRVRASTDAPDTATASVQVGGGAAEGVSVSSGAIDACVAAEEGRSVMITVTVEDTRGMASASVTVTIDTQPPTDTVDDASVTVDDRRGGVVRFGWTAPEDVGGLTLTSYVLRCADAPIGDEAAWDAAEAFPVPDDPASPGTSESQLIGGFRIGASYECTLRASDPTGALTPIGSSVTVSLDWSTETVTQAGSTGFGWTAKPIGDVDDDGFDDFIVIGEGEAGLVFGAATPSTAPTVRIVGEASLGYAPSTQQNIEPGAAGLGDFNGDGVEDFAIGEIGAASFAGEVFVFFGRSRVMWESTPVIDVSTSCAASLCIAATSAPSLFGSAVAGIGDFNGDGDQDMAVGAYAASGFTGQVYVFLGGSGVPTGSVAPADLDGFIVNNDVPGAIGSTVEGIGDVTGDGLADLVFNNLGPAGGMATIHRLPGIRYTAGSGLQPIASSTTSIVGGGDAARYGRAFCVGRYEGAGVLVAAYDSISSENRGRLNLSDATTGASLGDLGNDTPTNREDDGFGVSCASARHPVFGSLGDLDDDGRDDLLVGSDEDGSGPGTVSLFYGEPSLADRSRSGADETLNFTPNSPAGTPARRSVSYVGDVNGDGFPDFVVGDPRDNGGAGRVIIHY